MASRVAVATTSREGYVFEKRLRPSHKIKTLRIKAAFLRAAGGRRRVSHSRSWGSWADHTRQKQRPQELLYLRDAKDGVSVDVKVWRVGDAEQNLRTKTAS